MLLCNAPSIAQNKKRHKSYSKQAVLPLYILLIIYIIKLLTQKFIDNQLTWRSMEKWLLVEKLFVSSNRKHSRMLPKS